MRKMTALAALLAPTMIIGFAITYSVDNLAGLIAGNNSVFLFDGSPRPPLPPSSVADGARRPPLPPMNLLDGSPRPPLPPVSVTAGIAPAPVLLT